MEKKDWEDIYAQLFAYTTQLLKSHSWFRKKGTNSYLKGKQPHDYVAQAIESYLRNPEKYTYGSNRTLINYLKLHIIRTLVGNDARSPENKTSIDITSFVANDSAEENLNAQYLFPIAQVFYDQEIDYNNIMSAVKAELRDDDIAAKIFMAVCCNGQKRREIIEEFQLSSSEFDNGMKRLRTVLKQVAKKFDLTQE